MTSSDAEGEGLVRKTTRLLTNSEEIVQATHHRCIGGHRHIHLVSGRAKAAARYPDQLCRAMIKGFEFWKMGRHGGHLGSMVMEFARPGLCDPEEVKTEEESGRYIDDLKGDVIPPPLARAARAEELEVFQDRGVYDVVPRSQMRRGAKLVGVCWADTNKGSAAIPRIRSRLVCQEYNFGNDASGDMFAPTPPLGATRFLLSNLASRGCAGPGAHRAMLLDFKRAFLYGDCERELFIELPEEDPRRDGGACVGRLRKAMYGTRDASRVTAARALGHGRPWVLGLEDGSLRLRTPHSSAHSGGARGRFLGDGAKG